MTEIWSKQYFGHILVISEPIWLFLSSFETSQVATGIPVTIPGDVKYVERLASTVNLYADIWFFLRCKRKCFLISIILKDLWWKNEFKMIAPNKFNDLRLKRKKGTKLK